MNPGAFLIFSSCCSKLLTAIPDVFVISVRGAEDSQGIGATNQGKYARHGIKTGWSLLYGPPGPVRANNRTKGEE
jgi:hypothetical protein